MQPVVEKSRAAIKAKTFPAGSVSGRTEFLVTKLGGVTGLAEVLGVSKSQPSWWRFGFGVTVPRE